MSAPGRASRNSCAVVWFEARAEPALPFQPGGCHHIVNDLLSAVLRISAPLATTKA